MTGLIDLHHIRAALEKSSEVSSDFDLNDGAFRPQNRQLRPAGVLVALQKGDAGLGVVLTKRAAALKHHPGQIAFPGGKVDPTDATPTHAALREAHEEIGLPCENVEILGTLPTHETVTGFCITPVLAHVRVTFDPKPEPGEVDEVFCVPLSHLADLTSFQVQSRSWNGVHHKYYTVPFGPYYIWGATARILRGLAERLAL